MHDCEICGLMVDKVSTAACGHRTYLCFDCRRDCEGAMEECAGCENGVKHKRATQDYEAVRKARNKRLGFGS